MSTMIIIILTICCLTIQLNAEKSISNNSVYIPNSHIIIDPNTLVGDNYLFAACFGEKSGVENQCTVISIDHNNKKTCNVTVKTQPSESVESVIKFIPLDISHNRTRGVLIGLNKSALRFHFVDFHENGCTTKESTLNVESSLKEYYGIPYNIIPYGDSFDLIYADLKVCKDKLCRMTINSEGVITDGPHPWIDIDQFAFLNYWIPIEKGLFHQSSKGYLRMNPSSVTIVNSNGGIKELEKVDIPTIPPYGHSVSYKTIGICHYTTNYTLIKCKQFDQEGNIILEKFIEGGVTFPIIAMHNLKEGGFLMAVKSPKQTDKVYVISKYDKNGKQIGTLEIKEFSCKNRFKLWKLFENDLHKKCISMLCFEAKDQSDGYTGLFETSTICFEDSDFTVNIANKK